MTKLGVSGFNSFTLLFLTLRFSHPYYFLFLSYSTFHLAYPSTNLSICYMVNYILLIKRKLLSFHLVLSCPACSFYLHFLDLDCGNNNWRQFELTIKSNGVLVFIKHFWNYQEYFSSLIWFEGMSKKILWFVITYCLIGSEKCNQTIFSVTLLYRKTFFF